MIELHERSHAAPVSYLNSPELPAPLGHYSHVTIGAGLICISGQLPIGNDGIPLGDAPFEVQARRVLDQLEACLAAAGADRNHLLQVRVYIVDISMWPRFNEMYSLWIGDLRPARAVICVHELHHGAGIEIEATAINPHA